MSDDPYSLTDLARLADVTPRTVRYYVAQGLLPSPGAAGPATRYGDGHLARLRLIRRLQRQHLPLAEIRGRLERMGDAEIQAMLDAIDPPTPEPPIGSDETLAFVRGLMARAGVVPRFHDRPTAARPAGSPAAALGTVVERAAPQASGAPVTARKSSAPAASIASFGRPTPDAFPLRAPGDAPTPPALPRLPMPPPLNVPPSTSTGTGTPSRSTAGDRSTWERLVITPDVELHVRRPLDRTTNKRVDRLLRIARELFDEDV